jgi:hypothetical protein
VLSIKFKNNFSHSKSKGTAYGCRKKPDVHYEDDVFTTITL